MMQSQYDFLEVTSANPRNSLSRGLISWLLACPNRFFGGSKLHDFAKTNDGSLISNPLWTGSCGNFGRFGALSFNSAVSLQRVSAANTLPNLTAYTYVATLRPNFSSSSAGIARTVIYRGSGTANPRLYLRWELTRWIIDCNVTYRFDQTAPVAFATGQWIHLAVAGTGTTCQYYREGVPATTVSVVATSLNDTSNQPIEIGGSAVSSPFDGLIQDTMIYNRVLTASEIATLYFESLRGYPNLLLRRNVIKPGFVTDVTPGVFNAAWAQQSNILIGGGTY